MPEVLSPKQIELQARNSELGGYLQLSKLVSPPKPNERGMWIKSNSPWVEVVEDYNCYTFHKWDDQMPSLEAYNRWLKAGKRSK
jgi:hypothetical protein